MRPVERRASNASWKVTPTLITTAALVMGGCGGDTGTDTELLAADAITYIRNVIDPAYATPLPTPPFPEYTSGHSAQTAAALSTLQVLFGDIGYTDHTHVVDGFAPRNFASLSDSMLETGISRLYGGIHYRAAIFDGFAQGRCVSAKVNALPWRK